MPRLALLFLAACIACAADDSEDSKAKEALNAFAKAYASKDETARASAVSALGEVEHPRVVHVLGSLLTSDAESIRVAAAQALGKFHGRKDVVPALTEALASEEKYPKAEVAILRALGETGDPAAVPALRKHLKSEVPKRDKDDGSSEKAAIDALEKLHCKASLEALIETLKQNALAGGTSGKGQGTARKSREEVKQATTRAIESLTGEKLDSWREWEDWWKATSSKYDDQLSKK